MDQGKFAWLCLPGWKYNRGDVSREKLEAGSKSIDVYGNTTPNMEDFDGDGDLICGNSAGYIGFIENLDAGNPPDWKKPELLKADGEVIRIMAGENGSMHGPCERKWGYTTLSVADWDGDGLKDILINSIWGEGGMVQKHR